MSTHAVCKPLVWNYLCEQFVISLFETFAVDKSGGSRISQTDGGCQPRFVPKIAWKWLKLDRGARIPNAPLDLPMDSKPTIWSIKTTTGSLQFIYSRYWTFSTELRHNWQSAIPPLQTSSMKNSQSSCLNQPYGIKIWINRRVIRHQRLNRLPENLFR